MKNDEVRRYLTIDELRIFVAVEVGTETRAVGDVLRTLAETRKALLTLELDRESMQCALCHVEASLTEDGAWVVNGHLDDCIFASLPRPKPSRRALDFDDD